MGCVSSKIIGRTGSFRKELTDSLQRVGGLEELLNTSKNGGDQFLALLHASNTVAKKLKEGSPPHELDPPSDSNSLATPQSPDSTVREASEEEGDGLNAQEDLTKTTVQEEKQQELKGSDINNKVEITDIETINTWELLADLEEEKTNESVLSRNDSVTGNRSFRTVEDFDAMVARDQPTSVTNTMNRDFDAMVARDQPTSVTNTMNRDTKIEGLRRKSLAKELAALRVPAFEFSKSGSLRDWLLQGGQVFSPGSYATPKFGEFVPPPTEEKDGHIDVVEFELNGASFDPEMVAQFEKTIEQLTVEEEKIITEILQSLGGGNEQGNSSISETGMAI